MEDIEKGESERAKRVHEWGHNEDFGEVIVIGKLDEFVSVLPETKP